MNKLFACLCAQKSTLVGPRRFSHSSPLPGNSGGKSTEVGEVIGPKRLNRWETRTNSKSAALSLVARM
jgi:hypothetical protein